MPKGKTFWLGFAKNGIGEPFLFSHTDSPLRHEDMLEDLKSGFLSHIEKIVVPNTSETDNG